MQVLTRLNETNMMRPKLCYKCHTSKVICNKNLFAKQTLFYPFLASIGTAVQPGEGVKAEVEIRGVEGSEPPITRTQLFWRTRGWGPSWRGQEGSAPPEKLSSDFRGFYPPPP